MRRSTKGRYRKGPRGGEWSGPEAVYRREDGLVIVDPAKAKGRRELVEACPYGAIYYNEALDLPQKCTGCARLVDEGLPPHCVDAFPHEALRMMDEPELPEGAVADRRRPVRSPLQSES